MAFQTGFFYLFAAVLLFAALRVVTARNPVHAVLYLMLAFSQAAALWLLLKAEFLGITLVLVYLGAVMVLFLFVVMMLDINTDAIRQGFWRHLPLAAILGAIVSAQLIAVLWAGFPDLTVSAEAGGRAMHAPGHSNTYELGLLLYTQYLYPVQVAAVLLLVAMVAAIALTLRERKDSKAINPGLQVKVRAADRLSVVAMPATQKGSNAAPAADAQPQQGGQP
jgi:NADH-quinone oxidoreductase subunit J